MSSAVKTWKIIKPHVPLIQFKKGGRLNQGNTSIGTSAPSLSNIGKSQPGTGINDTAIPKKYHRKPISSIEIQAIEMGGIQAL